MSAPSPSLDFKRIAAEVTARHGICVKPDDPLMAAATLLELVLEDSAKKFTGELRSVLAELATAAERVQARSGAVLAQQFKEATAALKREINDGHWSTANGRAPARQAQRSATREIPLKWLAAGSISGLLLFVCGFLAGWISRSC